MVMYLFDIFFRTGKRNLKGKMMGINYTLEKII